MAMQLPAELAGVDPQAVETVLRLCASGYGPKLIALTHEGAVVHALQEHEYIETVERPEPGGEPQMCRVTEKGRRLITEFDYIRRVR